MHDAISALVQPMPRVQRQMYFRQLYDEIDRLPQSDDPAADLIDIGTQAVRRLALDHPGLFRIAFQRVAGLHADPGLVAAREKAWVQLQAALQRLEDAGLLGAKPVADAAREINAMWEGLANAEHWRAEEYHQRYLQKRGQAHCAV